MGGPGSSTASARTIFVLGVTQRTGTHFLDGMVRRHPDCVALAPRTINTQIDFEDYLLDRADLLDAYATQTQGGWGPPWSDDGALGDVLAASLGEGLLAGLEALLPTPDRGARLVARSPSIGRLDLITRVFPGARAVVVVRDPRAVADSAVRSFGALDHSTRPPWEGWVRLWDREVRRLLEITGSVSSLTVQTVRYEDLVGRRGEIMDRLLQFLDLDVDRYPFEELDEQPVLGSSEMVTETGYIHWDASTAPTGIRPEERGQGWPDDQRRRLAHLAGDTMAAMGYDPDVEVTPKARSVNAALDATTAFERAGKRLIRPLLRRRT